MAAQPSNIRIERIQLLQDEISQPLQHCFTQLESQHPQFGLDWLLNLSRHALDDGDEAVLIVAHGADGQLACLPVRISVDKKAQSLVNFYTSLFQPVTATERNSAQLAPLLSAILLHLRVAENINSLMLHPLDRTDPIAALLPTALSSAGWRGMHEFTCFANWYLDCPDQSWESYLQARPSKLRNTITRKTRAFLRDGRGELVIVTEGEALPAAIEQYTAIYNASWKQNEPYPNFTPRLIELAAQRGWLRLGNASYDGKPIASQIWLVANRTAYIFKLAYTPDSATLSPGTVLTAHMMASVLEDDKVTCVDYLSGDDAYKRDWMSDRRERHGFAAYNAARPRGLIQLLAYRTKVWLKSRRRPSRERSAS